MGQRVTEQQSWALSRAGRDLLTQVGIAVGSLASLGPVLWGRV
jgi:hypothetical protein